MSDYEKLLNLVSDSSIHINITSEEDVEEGVTSFLNISNASRYEFLEEEESLKVYYGDLVVNVNEDDLHKYIKLIKKENMEVNLVEKYHEDIVNERKIRHSI